MIYNHKTIFAFFTFTTALCGTPNFALSNPNPLIKIMQNEQNKTNQKKIFEKADKQPK